jgi:DNA-binding transcriptional LysR family regulator
LDVEYQEGVVDRFENSPVDLAFVVGLAGDGDADDYDCRPLGDLGFSLVAAPEHPLVQGPVTSLSRASHAELVVRDSSPRFARQSKGSFIGSKNVVYLSDFHSKRFALLAGAGYGWIPNHLVDDDLKNGRLRLLNTEQNQWTYHPQIITRRGHELGRGGRLFLETLDEKGPEGA